MFEEHKAFEEGSGRDVVQPLQGIRVVDLTRALSGPYATLLLAGLGAEVIKIEDPFGGDPVRDNSPYLGRDGVVVERQYEDDTSVCHLARSRGKQGVSLNLKHPQAQAIFCDLVRASDVVVENFAGGTADRLGAGYEAAHAANPRIIYASISGFGAKERPGRKAMDILIQALSGTMYTSGRFDDPPVRMGIPIADMLAPMFGVIGVLAALQQRERTGKGQHVDISMLGALTSFVAIEDWRAMELAGMETRTGPTLHRLAPFGIFECRDGYIALVASHDKWASGLFQAIDQANLFNDSRFRTRDARVANAAELEIIIGQWSREHTVEDALTALEKQGVPAEPVRHPQDAVADPVVIARGETSPVAHPLYGITETLRTAGIPILFSDAEPGFESVLPLTVGQHNKEVYGRVLGYDDKHLDELARQGVI